MAHYLIKYLDDNAYKKQLEFEGNTKVDALEKSNLNPNQVLSISLVIKFGSSELSLDIQELIISEIRALAQSGQAINKGLVKIIKRAGVAKKTNLLVDIDKGRTISKILSDIGMSKAVSAVVSAGENASRLDNALENSLIYIRSQKEIRNQIKSPFTEGIIIVLLSIAMIMFLPIIIAPVLDTLISGELMVDTNTMTDLLIFIAHNNLVIWIGITVFVLALFLLRKVIWEITTDFPILSNLNEFFILKRSVLLLMILRPLFESNISLNYSLNIIKSSMISRSDNQAMALLINKMSIGQPLSRAMMDKKYWSPILYNSFASFEQSILEAQLGLIDSVTQALLSRLTIVTHRISIQASLTGKLLAFFALLMIIIGYYFPSLTANVS